MKKVIFHVDVNSAFLSWEACYRIHHLGGKAGFATAGECRGRRSGEKTWDHFGKIYSGKKISYSDRGNGCFCKGKMSGPGSGAAQL